MKKYIITLVIIGCIAGISHKVYAEEIDYCNDLCQMEQVILSEYIDPSIFTKEQPPEFWGELLDQIEYLAQLRLEGINLNELVYER